MSIKPAIRIAAITLLASFASLIAASLWVGSDAGRVWLAGQLESYSDGAIVVSELQGHPLSRLTAATIEYRDAQLHIMVQEAAFGWSPMALFGGDLNILSLSASAVQIHELAGAEATAEADSDIPFELISRLRLQAVHIGSLEVFDPAGEAGAKLQNINVVKLAFSPRLSGTLKLEMQGQSANMELAGTLDDWELRLGAAPMQGLYPIVDMLLTGQQFEQGGVQLNVKLEHGAVQSGGQWSVAEGLIRGEGEVQTDFTPAKGHGIWQMTAETNSGILQFSLNGDVDAGPQLNRPLHLAVNAAWEDGKLQGALHESDQALAVEWGFSDGVLQLTARMDQWMVPLRQAKGVITGAVAASINSKTLAWNMNAEISEGRMAGLMARLNISGQGDGETWQLQRGHAALLGVNIDASGRGDLQTAQLQGHASSKDLKPALALAGIKAGGGAFDSDFHLNGQIASPKLDWDVQFSHLQAQGVELGRLQSTGWLLLNLHKGELSINANNIHLESGQSWQRIKMQAKLDEQRLSVQSSAIGELGGDIQLAATGRNNIWNGKIEQLRMHYRDSPLLHIAGMPWQWQTGRLDVPESEIRIADIPARIFMQLGDSGPTARLQMPAVELNRLKPWLGPGLKDLDGRLHMDMHVDGTWQTPSFSLKAGADKLAMQWPEGDIALPPPVVEKLQLSAVFKDHMLKWKISGNSLADGTLNSEGSLPWFISFSPWVFSSIKDKPGRASLSLQLGELAVFQPWLPGLYPLVGNASVRMDIRDPLGTLQADAELKLALTELGIPQLGLDMQGEMLANWRENRAGINIKMNSGDGELTMQGPVSWPPEQLPTLNFNHFPIMQLPDQQVIIDGHLNMRRQQKIIWLKGKVTATKLRIEIPDVQPKPTADLVWSPQQKEQDAADELPLTQLDVTLNLGKAAEIFGRGMNMRLAGELQLGGSLGRPHLTGELSIPEGGFDYRNIHLDVLPKSRAVFSGDPERPLLYVQAGRKIDDTLVGVQIEGPVDRLQSRLFSTPAMPDAEILAYLVTGRPLASLGKDGAADAMSMAGFMLGSGSAVSEVQNKVQRSLGLDSLEVEAGLDSGKVAAGKKIGKRTTVKLEETIAAESTTAITLEYLLTNSFTLFARQVQNAAPTLGLRYRKQWMTEKRE